MRVCIYKTDDLPELTLLLREGLMMPGETKDANWAQFKIVTRGELSGELLAKMELTGHCVVQLGEMSKGDHKNPLLK